MVEKKNKMNTSQRQKSRAKYNCPAELSELIYQANLVPFETIMPNFNLEIEREIERLREVNGGVTPELSSYDFLTGIIKDLPQNFLEYLENLVASLVFLPEGLLEENLYFRHEFVNQYVRYCDMRDSMLWLVQKLESERQGMRNAEAKSGIENGSLTFDHYASWGWDTSPVYLKTHLYRDNAGKLHLTELAALIGKFDDSRLRRCQICNNIYWAKRENSKTCSAKCLNVINVRKYRSLTNEEKEEKKTQRKANKIYKDNLKNKR